MILSQRSNHRLSRDPHDYVRLTINITLDYGISASGQRGTLCYGHARCLEGKSTLNPNS